MTVVYVTSSVPERMVPSAVSRMSSADCFRLYRRVNLAPATRSGSAQSGILCVLAARGNMYALSRHVKPNVNIHVTLFHIIA
jgi:hypothetical protein